MSQDGEEVSKTEMPSSIERFLEYVAMQSAVYGNCLNYREENRIKADMMNCPSRWKGLTADQIRNGCLVLGMTKEDADQIAHFRQRVIDGHKFRPKYDKKFIFEGECISEYAPGPIETSRDW
ncbi:MAG: hypothetical protein LBC35_03925 [Coriobacteriales bacterium]|jgi:hypothetical protein|nr:hypothetical protein [Coriobacteriales bacterium]